jgi:hypothetical protein
MQKPNKNYFGSYGLASVKLITIIKIKSDDTQWPTTFSTFLLCRQMIKNFNNLFFYD